MESSLEGKTKGIMRQIILRHPGVSEINTLSSTEIAGEEMAFDKY